ncbi:MAG: hypothetical protein HQL52_04920 [Magnetococcales bacterium]|nr:hypothetical protein [Magnetococcales bacterium]
MVYRPAFDGFLGIIGYFSDKTWKQGWPKGRAEKENPLAVYQNCFWPCCRYPLDLWGINQFPLGVAGIELSGRSHFQMG